MFTSGGHGSELVSVMNEMPATTSNFINSAYTPPPQVSGVDRWKFFKRPIVPFMQSSFTPVIYSKRLEKNAIPVANVASPLPSDTTPVQPTKKSISVQTSYRFVRMLRSSYVNFLGSPKLKRILIHLIISLEMV